MKLLYIILALVTITITIDGKTKIYECDGTFALVDSTHAYCNGTQV